MYESDDKLVSHPDHYGSKDGLEVIDVIKAFTSELKGIEATDTGNIIKYACRWKKKNGVQDLKKIMWYCQHLIDHVESETPVDTDESKPKHVDALGSVIYGYQFLSEFEKSRNAILDAWLGNRVCRLIKPYEPVFLNNATYSKT